MGRPSLTCSRTRAAAAKAMEEDDTSLSSAMSFRRRYPRMGSQFQAKVPKKALAAYATDRPQPIPMSNQVPHMTKDEFDSLSNQLVGKLEAPLPASSSSSNTMVVGCRMMSVAGTKLRGMYEEKSLPSTVPKLDKGRNTFAIQSTSTSNQNNQNAINKHHKRWVGALVSWHDAHEKAQLTQSGRGRKSRFKRPREVPALPDLPPPLKIRALENLTSNQRELQVPVEQEQWRLVVDLSAGQAAKRIRERKRKESASTDVRWRTLCENGIPFVRGDYRNSNPNQQFISGSHADVSHVTNAAKETWKAVLACATAFQKVLSDGSSVPLSTLLTLFRNVAMMEPPEQVWVSGETIVSDINTTLDVLADGVERTRKLRAEWIDLWHQEGVELDVLRKSLKKGETGVQPDDLPELIRQVKVVADWQTRVDQARASPRSAQNDLQELEDLYNEAKPHHGFRSKGLLALEARLQKADELRGRILAWKSAIADRTNLDNPPPLENLKFLSALVREIARLKLKFPSAAYVLDMSQSADAWVERANIAIRSRISLTEIQSLIQRGEELPLELNEFLDKLKARERKAQDWLDQLSEYVPVPDYEKMPLLEWMGLVRLKLNYDGGSYASLLHDLACEGSRIPVEIDCVKLLQIELDARNWSIRAKTWLPDDDVSTSSKQGKLEDIREHLEKAKSIRCRLPLPFGEKDQWRLEYEMALSNILEQAHAWHEQYREFLESDSRRSTRPEASIMLLREIVEKGDSIHVSLGPSGIKMAKILSQAETWFEKWNSVVSKCQPEYSGFEKVSLDDLKEAIQEASSSIGVVELQEANEMVKLAERVEKWFERANVAVGGKKLRGKQKYVFGADDLSELIQEGKVLPVDTSVLVEQLEAGLQLINSWKERVIQNTEAVGAGFQQLKEAVDSKYGDPSDFCPSSENLDSIDSPNEEQISVEEKKSGEEMCLGSPSLDTSESKNYLELNPAVGEIVKDMCQEVKTSCLVTEEGHVFLHLEDVLRWTARSLKYLEIQKEIFDKRFFGAFDRFLAEGKVLLDATMVVEESPIYVASLSWRAFIGDQMKRMEVLLQERGEYVAWCKRAEDILSGNDKKLKVEKLREVLARGCRFPGDNETVTRISELAKKADGWVSATASALESEDKLALHEAKALLEEGNRLGVLSNELKALRNGLKTARAWATKVKRIKPEDGKTQYNVIKALIDEYDDLVIGLPEEYKRLSNTVQNYCICRRPYEGFMIQCEKCDEWFHGACVGVTQARAEKKTENYVCVRCLVAKVFHSSTSSIAAVLKKWTSDGELKKARMLEAQKHQRRVRKETNDLEKLRKEAEKITLALSKRSPPFPGMTVHQTPNVAVSTDGALSVSPEKQKVTASPESHEDLGERIEKVTSAIKICQSKLQDLAEVGARQRNDEEIENDKAGELRKWCIRVRSIVLAPSSKEQSKASQPSRSGALPLPMLTLVQDADKHSLMQFADVKTVLNSFKCLCWSSHAMYILSRRPKASDAVTAVRLGSSLKLPDEKGLRMIKAMAHRATAWHVKASRLLNPTPGETRPYDVKELQSLSELADDIPLKMVLEPRVHAVIEDSGSRHCICGGPSDGRLMLSCDKCEKWFHAHCVGIKKEESEVLEEWQCPPCRGVTLEITQDLLHGFHDGFGPQEDESTGSEEGDVSSKAPLAEKLWPPFGLLGSATAVEQLGERLCSFPDDTEPWHLECCPVGTQFIPRIHISAHGSNSGDTSRSGVVPMSHTHIVSSSSSLGSDNRAEGMVLLTAASNIYTSAFPGGSPSGVSVQQSHPSVLNQNWHPTDSTPGSLRSESQHSGLLSSSYRDERSDEVELSNVEPVDGAICDSVAQLLAMKDIMVAPLQDNRYE